MSAVPTPDPPLAPALAAAADDAAWREAAKAGLAARRGELRRRFEAGEAIDRLVSLCCEASDLVVASAWARCLPPDAPLQLLATGGYGRAELYPQSDIDLLVLGEPAAQKAHEAAIGRFFSLLWDAGLATSQAVRSLDQCVEAAREDITVLTSLMECRSLAGDAAAPAALAAALAPTALWPPAEYFAAKREEQRSRHLRFHDTAHNLEPNLKEGPGGLRDLQTVTWMGMRLYGVPGLRALVPLGLLGEDECASLEREWRQLARLRFGLHLLAGRREERLGFDHQKTLAAMLGLKDEHRDNLAVEQMMQAFFRSAATVMRINDRLLQRFEEQLSGEASAVPVAEGYALRHGYLAMREPERLREGLAPMLALFAAWDQAPGARGLHSETARALGESLSAIRPCDEQPPEVRQRFMALLESGQAVATLTRMARLGVLARYLPAFGRVSGRMQYDLFHVYTVDQHTLTVLAHMAGFASRADERFAIAHEVLPRLRKPHLLLLAGLFHDIAKGRGGDHSELGAVDAREFAQVHAMPAADADLLAWLVEQHLLMSVTAQRQDISDPEVVARFANKVADREHLDYLYLLTCADIAGTSPKLWNAWKDRLLADLYSATRFALRRGLENPVHANEIMAETRAKAMERLLGEGLDEATVEGIWAAYPDVGFLRYRPEQIAWQTRGIAESEAGDTVVLVRPHLQAGGLEVFVRALDRDGLFAALVATLDRLGLNVLEARVLNSSDGHALDTFQLIAPQGIAPETEAVVAAIKAALRDPARVRPVRRAAPRQLRHFRVPARVAFDTVADGRRTRMSLVCTDQPGLLAGVAQVLRQHRLRVHDARIATFGEKVEDFFLLTDERDRAVEDQALLDKLSQAIVACVDGETDHGKKEARP
ncbi:MAG TPA: [protein-PII] uridylyltransferase [Arenimonas sp.]|uniref:[protein-PII] uridylyltransferase n=1 Tax=Arenimonas sp. TaxID=1872635 RepID=UPI002D8005F6|nr:[protein-PII] uridylyltransferase [Arenimonas sp.]HEU0152134.1 [protein-PII] uridylyltransferase [Arenimonas sp.]